MAIVKVTPSPYSSNTDLQNLIAYILNPQKTCDGAYAFTRGINPGKVFEDFCEAQTLYGSTEGHRAYHIIIEFSKNTTFTSMDAAEIAYRISEMFYPPYQVICGVHVDQIVPHIHFAVNTVPIDPVITRKLHITQGYIYMI